MEHTALNALAVDNASLIPNMSNQGETLAGDEETASAISRTLNALAVDNACLLLKTCVDLAGTVRCGARR